MAQGVSQSIAGTERCLRGPSHGSRSGWGGTGRGASPGGAGCPVSVQPREAPTQHSRQKSRGPGRPASPAQELPHPGREQDRRCQGRPPRSWAARPGSPKAATRGTAEPELVPLTTRRGVEGTGPNPHATGHPRGTKTPKSGDAATLPGEQTKVATSSHELPPERVTDGCQTPLLPAAPTGDRLHSVGQMTPSREHLPGRHCTRSQQTSPHVTLPTTPGGRPAR